MSLQWLQQQRSTPSFASAKSPGGDQLNSVLDQPMPSALRDVGGDSDVFGNVSSVFSPNDQSSRFSVHGSARRARTPPATMERSQPRARSASSAYTSAIVDSRGLPRQIDVFESLYERAKLGAEAKDRMRIEAEKEKMKRCRSVPKINRMNDDNITPSTTSIFQRLLNKDKERQVNHHTKILIMQKKENELLSTLFQPRISNKGHRSKGSGNGATSSEKYSFKTVQRMEELRKEKIMKEMEMIMDTPDINPRSRLMAQKQREKEGLAGYSHIEAMLERDRLTKLARYEQRERELIAQHPGTPRITEYAAGLQRGGESAAERLYRSASNRSGLNASGSGADDAPQVSSIYTPNNRPQARDEGEFSNLARHEMETRARRDEKMRKIVEAETRSHTPKINPVSAAIASRLPTTTGDRLASTTPRRAGATSISSAFQPDAVKASGHSASDTPSTRDVQLFERLRIAEARRRMRIEAARMELEQRREEECTFAPVTTTTYYPPSQRVNSDLYSRSLQWQQSRDEKVRQKREEDDVNTGQECTFQPAVSRKTQAIFEVGGYDKLVEDGANKVAGFDNFVSRSQRAKASSGDQEHESFIGGRAWDGSTFVPAKEITVPSFEVSRKAPPVSTLVSTRPPVEPPSAVTPGQQRQGAGGDVSVEDARSIRSHLYSSFPQQSIYSNGVNAL